MSTALSTEMPTSAARSAGASLMPSPMNPTTWPLPCSAFTIALLVRRREPRENIRRFHGLGQLRVGHRLDLAAKQDFLRVDADFASRLCG